MVLVAAQNQKKPQKTKQMKSFKEQSIFLTDILENRFKNFCFSDHVIRYSTVAVFALYYLRDKILLVICQIFSLLMVGNVIITIVYCNEIELTCLKIFTSQFSLVFQTDPEDVRPTYCNVQPFCWGVVKGI